MLGLLRSPSPASQLPQVPCRIQELRDPCGDLVGTVLNKADEQP